jgi:DNA-binding NtrC family response regulator
MLVQLPATFDTRSADPLPSTARDLPRRAGKCALQALVVDDEPLIRWAIAETLRVDGYEVDEAGDADGTVRALFERPAPPDLIVLDLRLPDCSDLTLLQTVRRLVPSATVILMTAFATPDLHEQARRLGAAGVLDKPFDVDAIAALVENLRSGH